MILDALVIGGGPAGAATAILLAEAGWSVAIVEKSRFPRRKVCGEFLSASGSALLDRLGVGEAFQARAGPPVRRVGLFARDATIVAPPKHGRNTSLGRALGREAFDALLLERAARLGARVLQPARVVGFEATAAGHACAVEHDRHAETLAARVVVAAHGSWERGVVGQAPQPHRGSDLLAFKAHFQGGGLLSDLMPLIAFPGGYGGMVHCDGGRMSLSLCIRRDTLAAARHRSPGVSAGDAVLGHVIQACRGVRAVLADAEREGPWLAAGPIRPGIRRHYADGLFCVGNLAGEAHPVIAEGIGMAIQSAELLARELILREPLLGTEAGRAGAGAAYAAAWRRSCAPRIRAAALFATVAMRPAAAAALPLIERFPAMLSLGARLSGKAC